MSLSHQSSKINVYNLQIPIQKKTKNISINSSRYGNIVWGSRAENKGVAGWQS